MKVSEEIFNLLEEISKFNQNKNKSEGVTRLFLTKEHSKLLGYLKKIMEEIGLEVKIDNIGNIIGTYKSKKKTTKTLVIGSHQDTVRNGGKYDGILGVILPLIVIKKCIKEKINLNYNVKIVAFGDEEGVRFAVTYLGSKVLAGTFTEDLLDRTSEEGKTLKEELISFGLNPQKITQDKLENISGYLEVHIEQGPVLEKENIEVGVVNTIQGTYRYKIELCGMAGHAGTVPMKYRSDAGVCAAEIISEFTKYVEKTKDLVATFGVIKLYPGSINVIPGKAFFTLDIRSQNNNLINESVRKFYEIVEKISKKRKIKSKIENTDKVLPSECSLKIINKLKESITRIGKKPFILPSGAGHDSQEMGKVTDMGMLFVRCKEGISHNPLEAVKIEDLEIAAKVIFDFIINY